MVVRWTWVVTAPIVLWLACGGQAKPPDDAKAAASASPSASAGSVASASPSASASAAPDDLAALLDGLEGDDDGEEKQGKGDNGDEKEKSGRKKKLPTPAERAERHCAATCARRVRCMDDDVVDRDTLRDCRRDCRRGEGRRIHRLRNAFAFVYASCLDELDCDDVVSVCRDRVAARVLKVDESSRAGYLACEARRRACGKTTERCMAYAWSNPGIRRAMTDCLRRPCGQLESCLRDAGWR